jgi:hypothetical protein
MTARRIEKKSGNARCIKNPRGSQSGNLFVEIILHLNLCNFAPYYTAR